MERTRWEVVERRYTCITSVTPLMSSEMWQAGNEIVMVLSGCHHCAGEVSRQVAEMVATDSYPRVPQGRSVAEEDDTDACRLAGIRAGDRGALELIYCQYSGQVVRFLSIVEPGQSPEEACLEVFERLWHGAAAGQVQGGLVDCIFRIAYHALVDRGVATEGHSFVKGDIRSAVGALSRDQRAVVALVYGAGLSLDSISTITGMTDEEITGYLGQARDRLRHPVVTSRDPTGARVDCQSSQSCERDGQRVP